MKVFATASLMWCVAGFGVLISWGFFRDFEPPVLVSVLAAVGIVAGIVRLLVGRRHTGELVFWCRRFGDTGTAAGALNRWHGRIIDEASRGVALPVTLQDESVDSPPLVASAVVLPVFLVMMVGSLGSSLWLFELPWFEASVGKVAVFVAGVLALTAPSVVAWQASRLLGARRVVPAGVARTIRRATGRRRSRSGMLVLRCESKHWQECVIAVLDEVALTIIDVSMASSNVDWEIRTAADRMGPDALLLLQADLDASGVERLQQPGSTMLRYNLALAHDELGAFTREWSGDKHQLVDPDAALGPVGLELAAAIRQWIRESNPERLRKLG